MADTDLWSKIHAERRDFADFVAELSDEQLATQSLCTEWSVRDMVGHLIAGGNNSVGHFLGGLIGSGFRFNKFVQKDLERYNKGSAGELAEKLRATASGTNAPPAPTQTWLGEAIVHAEDIRRPLGVKHTYPADHVAIVADFYKGSNLLIGAKKRIAGLRLQATDMDWSTGSGPEVTGPGVALVSAMTGRKAALADLSGEGVQQLSARM